MNQSIDDLLRAANLRDTCVPHSDGSRTASHIDIIQALKATEGGDFVSVVRGASVYPSHDAAKSAAAGPPPRSPQLEARLARIRARNELAEYNRMVKDIRGVQINQAASAAESVARFGSQMSIAMNVIITMGTCFVAGYFVFRHSSGNETVGLIGGLIGLIGAMVVEAVLIMTRLYSVEQAVRKQEREQHTKSAYPSMNVTPSLPQENLCKKNA